MLAIAWQLGPHRYLESRAFDTLTERVPARIVDRWLAIEFDPVEMGRYPNWRASTLASPCMVVEYEGGWGAAQRRAFCGTRLPFYEHYMLDEIAEVSPGVPFAWSRDDRGFVVTEMRMSKATFDYLDKRTGEAAQGMPDAPSVLTSLRGELDRPVDSAIIGWRNAESPLTVAVNPAEPSQSWPVGYMEASRARGIGWFGAIMAGLFGLFLWFAGIRLLAGNHRLPLVLFVGALPLLWVPWFADKIPPLVKSMNRDFGQVIGDMMGTVDGVDRFVASAPEEATLASGARVVLAPGKTGYADSFGRIAFRRPDTTPRDADAALVALADTVATQMRAMDDDARSAVFAALARDKRDGHNRVGVVFLRAAREALVAPDTPPQTRAQARRFLDAWVTQPVDEPWPSQPGFGTRLVLLRELTQLPPPDDVAVRAGWILERGEQRAREKK